MYSASSMFVNGEEQESAVVNSARAVYLQRKDARTQAKMHILERLCKLHSSMGREKQLPPSKQPQPVKDSKMRVQHASVVKPAGLEPYPYTSPQQHKQRGAPQQQHPSKPPLPPIPLMHRSSLEDGVSAFQNRMPQIPVDSTPAAHTAHLAAHVHGHGAHRSNEDAGTAPLSLQYQQDPDELHSPDTPIPLPANSPVSTHATNTQSWSR
jgi:hypothetical protein